MSLDTRFIEALDSVRGDVTIGTYDPDLTRRHAEAEMMLAVLFGERVSLPEPHAFDSLHFASIAAAMLRSPLRPDRANDTLGMRFPFVLALRSGHESYKGMVSDLIGRVDLSSQPVVAGSEPGET